MVLEWIVGATVAVSLVSLVGVMALGLRERLQKIVLFAAVAFAAGTLLGGAFFDLLPESLEKLPAESALSYALAGLVFFFIVEKFIAWHHHHEMHAKSKGKAGGKTSSEKPFGYLNVVGDGLHNFFDGAAIAASFMAGGVPLGITTTLVIALHEIPQEIGDYSLLVYSGFKSSKALAFNLLSGLLAVLGGVVFYFASPAIENLEGIGLAFTAGAFIYIASSDLFPEFHRETNAGKSLLQLALILAGIAAIRLIVSTFGG